MNNIQQNEKTGSGSILLFVVVMLAVIYGGGYLLSAVRGQ